jgi:two-component system, cell cycle sensor histidine kinase and response regulator CckA
MQKRPNKPPTAIELRRSAEERLQEQQEQQPPTGEDPKSEADTQRVLHELQVHQIELEMQNAELQQARNEMEAGLEKYSELYDFAPVGYLTIGREGMIREANLAAASLLGVERSRLVQRRFGLYVSTADLPVFNTFLARVFAGKARESCEVTLLKDGQPPVEVRIEAAVAGLGRECRAVLEDITALKQAEKDRLILNKLESTGILAGGIAHDFNNLLTVILLDLELAQALNPPDDVLAHHLDEAKQTALAASALTQQLITFARGGAPVRKPTRLPGLIQESAQTALSGSKVYAEFSLPDDLWPAEVDAGQIGQVIRNLVLNAREAMAQGGAVSIRAENVTLKPGGKASLPPGNYVRVSIIDRGVGIARKVLPNIFDPYFSTKERGNQKGMGLGLTICHTVIQRHEGAIDVESKLGLGTTFHIHLPAASHLPEREVTPEPKQPAPKGRILVMDDEEAVRKLVALSLWGMGHAVELAEDGRRAIEVYEKARSRGHPFDVVILDLTVRDGMGGREAIQALLKLDPAVKAMVMSGYADDPAVLEPELYGFKGVLTKPFNIEELQQTLARIMQN